MSDAQSTEKDWCPIGSEHIGKAARDHLAAAKHRLAPEGPRRGAVLEVDVVAGRLAAVEAVAERWDGDGHGPDGTHWDEQPMCSVCQVLAEVRAALRSRPAGGAS